MVISMKSSVIEECLNSWNNFLNINMMGYKTLTCIRKKTCKDYISVGAFILLELN